MFAFTRDFQGRLEKLLEKKKTDLLNSSEEAELAGISELQRIFTLINAQLANQAKCGPIDPDNWYDFDVGGSGSEAVTPSPQHPYDNSPNCSR